MPRSVVSLSSILIRRALLFSNYLFSNYILSPAKLLKFTLIYSFLESYYLSHLYSFPNLDLFRTFLDLFSLVSRIHYRICFVPFTINLLPKGQSTN